MKLDTKAIRYLSTEDWRILTAVEMGSKNHEVVPTTLITQISNLRAGSAVQKCISTLAKINLIAKVRNTNYDGYRLAYGGLDYLALNAHRKSDAIYSVGNQIGVGKESDIYVVASTSGVQRVLKIHRLGRISFRTVKANRDYLRNRSSGSWMYMSRLAALKEYTFMQTLRDNGFSVPEPIAQNRHTIVMSLVDAFPLRQISSVPDPGKLYSEIMAIIVRLAEHGLIHGDFNEFNILIEEKAVSDTADAPQQQTESETGTAETPVQLHPVLIDFPQMMSISHPNAEYYFDRDVNCIKTYFERRYHFTSDDAGPTFSEATKGVHKRLDVDVEATGFSKKMAKELEKYMKEHGVDGDASADPFAKDDRDDDEVDDEDNVQQEKPINSADQPEPKEQMPSNQDPNIPSTSLATSFTVLDIQDTEPRAPVAFSSITKATTAKAAAGWSI